VCRALLCMVGSVVCATCHTSLGGPGAAFKPPPTGYFNPFLAYGMDKLIADVADAGGDGFIVVDLPPEEGQ
jgi:hypothetical protein